MGVCVRAAPLGRSRRRRRPCGVSRAVVGHARQRRPLLLRGRRAAVAGLIAQPLELAVALAIDAAAR
eukprot:4167020-Pyramimonas_sp.AAC.1